MRIFSTLIAASLCMTLATQALAGQPRKLTVNVDQPGAKIGPLFYGLMTEEINHAYDGGLYAELIQNRIFQDKKDEPAHWSVVHGNNAAGNIAIDETNPVNTIALTRSLRLDVTGAEAGERVGIANEGFWGIPVWPNTKYHASFYARASEGFSGPLKIDIESNDGATTFANATVPSVGKDWKKYEVDLKAGDVPPSSANRFVISTTSKGSIWFSLVSLFPPTYNNRPNGNRIDLMQKLADLHPAFLRFPGGNYLEGDYIPDRFDWKRTIGPLEDRPGHPGCWGYRSSDGLGLLEFLEWCQDLHMEPLLAVYAGYSLRGDHVTPGEDFKPFVQEDLDEIEYCTGDTSTTWGARRAKDGHPEPFVIHYIEIGNEDGFDKSGGYDARFAQLFDAIKAKYPKLQCIATAPVHSRTPDLYDDHSYPSPRAMERMVHRYDNHDPSKPKVFFGEWATQDGKPTPTMRAAIADAAWMTGLQHDANTVLMQCYAPLFVNVNKGAWQWPTNLIGYDAASSFGSPSYYAQAMFSRNWGDTDLPVEVGPPPADVQPPPPPAPQGFVGVGTWHTSAEFKDIKVTHGDTTLFTSNFADFLDVWKRAGGKWDVRDGAMAQSDESRETRLTAGDPTWQDYTVSLKARKLGGREGFLVLFHVRDKNNYLWFNVGGWGNTRCGVEQCTDGEKANAGTSTPITIDTGRWYDLRVEVQGRQIKCYVDDKLVSEATDTPAKPTETLYAAASRLDSSGEIILKLVNAAEIAQPVEVNLNGQKGLAKDASVEVISGRPNDVNTITEPTKVAPRQETISDAGTSFTHELPAGSVTVIRLKPQ